MQNRTKPILKPGVNVFISDIVGSLSIGAPTISHHLKELANAELIITERREKFLAARINTETIQTASAILSLIEK